jgi:hypothetical protein
VKGTGSWRILFANVDDELTLFVNDRRMAFDRPTQWSQPVAEVPLNRPVTAEATPGSAEPSDLSPIGVTALGVDARVRDLRVLRDTDYISASGMGMRQDVKMRCPSCGGWTVFVAEGGGLTCSQIGCDQPDVASTVLHIQSRLEAALKQVEELKEAALDHDCPSYGMCPCHAKGCRLPESCLFCDLEASEEAARRLRTDPNVMEASSLVSSSLVLLSGVLYSASRTEGLAGSGWRGRSLDVSCAAIIAGSAGYMVVAVSVPVAMGLRELLASASSRQSSRARVGRANHHHHHRHQSGREQQQPAEVEARKVAFTDNPMPRSLRSE